jgi:dGTPase
MMNWNTLLSPQRFIDKKPAVSSPVRSRFEQDFDRIIFSHPFRKLQDKTQVFPLPEDDFVHNRLTHSLEVSCVGRSLGKEVGVVLSQRHSNVIAADVGAIVAAAALAHDLGNPPFGHSGEDAISSFFLHQPNGVAFQNLVSREEWMDLSNFEGNAQGFRILNREGSDGLRLTLATLAAFTKYPRSSSAQKIPERKSQKKYGFTQSEKGIFQQLSERMGLVSLENDNWCRHPLAFSDWVNPYFF